MTSAHQLEGDYQNPLKYLLVQDLIAFHDMLEMIFTCKNLIIFHN